MDNIWSVLHEKIKAGEDTVMVTIVESSGSVPRGKGARMLVAGEGRISGTIGGGAVEFESIKTSLDVLAKRSSCCRKFILDNNDAANIGMVCGGNIEVFFQFISAKDEKLVEEMEAVYESVLNGKTYRLQLTFDGKVYEEIIDASQKVYIFGGGHVAQQLVPVLARCDFNCVVIEDRPEYADPGLFENKCDIILVEEGTLSQNLPDITENDFVCIMTRGHKDDYLLQAAVLKGKAAYIGVIGSRRKIAAVNAKLFADGFTQEDIERITSPIGIDIMSETPAEIAVSIAAQLIMVRAGRR